MGSQNQIVRYLTTQISIFAKQLKRAARDPGTKNVHQLRITIHRMRPLLGKTLSHALHELDQVLGAKRELDVALKDAVYYGFNPALIQRQRRQAKQQVVQFLKPKYQKKILGKLKKFQKKLNVESIFKDREMHQLRINLKKIRYILEASGQTSERLRILQSELGRLHDLQVLKKISGSNKKLSADLARQYRKATTLLKAAPV